MRALRIFVMWLLIAGICSSSAAQAGSWLPKGPPGTPIVSLAVDPLDPDIVYAGTRSGGLVFKSTDAGHRWVDASTGLLHPSAGISFPGYRGYHLAIDQDFPTTVWSATGAPGTLFVRSDDAAATWFIGLVDCVLPFPQSLGVLGGYVITASPEGLFAGAPFGFFGRCTRVTARPISAIAIDAKTRTAYAAGPYVFLRYIPDYPPDFADTWYQFPSALYPFYDSFLPTSLAIDPSSPNTVYAGVEFPDGVFKSVDGGATWPTFISGPSSPTSTTSPAVITVDPLSADTLYAAFNDECAHVAHRSPVFKSVVGNSWMPANEGLPISLCPSVMDLAIGCRRDAPPHEGGVCDSGITPTLYAATTDGVFKSIDRGDSWEAVNGGLPSGQGIQTVAIACEDENECKGDPARPRTLYALSGSFAPDIGCDTIPLPSFDSRRLWKSTDDGDHWQPVPVPLPSSGFFGGFITAVAIDPQNAETAYAATVLNVGAPDATSMLWRTSDGGMNWTEAGNGLPKSRIRVLTMDPKSSATLYAGTSGDGVYKSIKAGASWSPVNDGLPGGWGVDALAVDPRSTDTVYVAGTGRVFRSEDGGGHWEPLGSVPTLTINALAIDSEPGTVYAAGSGLYVTDDGGAKWTRVLAGCVSSVISVPREPGTVYAGTPIGVFKISNGGAKAEPLNTGLGSTQISALVIHPGAVSRVYAGTVDRGADSGRGLFALAGCGDGYVDRSLGELCDAGDSNGEFGSCCTSRCGFAAAGTLCRAPQGVCDLPHVCSGSGVDCPDFPKLTGVCRPAADLCDVAESCDGIHNECPADKVKQGEKCGPGPGDVCNGRDKQCPFNCGNGKIDPGEQCDDGELNGTPDDGCRRDCKLKCGDGNLDPQEQCDSEPNCTSSCRLACTKDSDCGHHRPNRCTRLLCEKNGLCATGMGCPDDPCTGVSGGINLLMCGFARQLGGDNCASPTNRKVADRVNGQLVGLLGKLRTVSALCGRAHAQKMIRSQLARVEGKLGSLAVLAAQNTDQVCFDELNGIATENDGRLAFLQLQAHFLRKKLSKRLPDGNVPCELLNAGSEPSHVP